MAGSVLQVALSSGQGVHMATASGPLPQNGRAPLKLNAMSSPQVSDVRRPGLQLIKTRCSCRSEQLQRHVSANMHGQIWTRFVGSCALLCSKVSIQLSKELITATIMHKHVPGSRSNRRPPIKHQHADAVPVHSIATCRSRHVINRLLVVTGRQRTVSSPFSLVRTTVLDILKRVGAATTTKMLWSIGCKVSVSPADTILMM
jgi:hypothetical protein